MGNNSCLGDNKNKTTLRVCVTGAAG